jgi:hypothetical protein
VACEEKRKLADAYRTSADEFARVVAELQEKTGTSSKPKYEAMRWRTEQARMNMEQARLNLERHVSEHSC